MRAGRILLLALVASCVVPEGLLEQRPCPCADGFACVEGRCVPGASDAGRDAGVDLGLDLGVEDVGTDAPADAPGDAGDPERLLLHFDCEAVDDGFVRDRSGPEVRDARCDGAGCPELAPGVVGSACDFTDEDRRLRVSFDPALVPGRDDGPDALTVSMWVYLNDRGDPTPTGSAIGIPVGSGRANVYQLYFASGRPGYVTAEEAGIVSVYASGTAPLETWVHYALVYDAGVRTFYIDGVEAGRETFGPPPSSNQDLLIGADENEGSVLQLPIDARVDEIRIYGRALGPGEVASLAAEGT